MAARPRSQRTSVDQAARKGTRRTGPSGRGRGCVAVILLKPQATTDRQAEKQKTAAPTAGPCRLVGFPSRPTPSGSAHPIHPAPHRVPRPRPSGRVHPFAPPPACVLVRASCRRRHHHRHRAPARCSGREEARALPITTEGAQRASSHRSLRLTVTLAIAVMFAGVGLAAHSDARRRGRRRRSSSSSVPPARAPRSTSPSAKALAAQARSYGASVYEVYSPRATWTRVKAAAQGANVLIYLGHGNGHPSPYGAFSKYTKDGMGLNPSLGSTRHKYYGEYYIDTPDQPRPQCCRDPQPPLLCVGQLRAGPGHAHEVGRDPAGRQLRRRLPPGERQGGLRRGPSTARHSSLRAVQDEQDDGPDLLERARRAMADTTSCSRRPGRDPGTASSIRSAPAATTGRSSATST